MSCVSTNGPDKPVACLERWSPPLPSPPPSSSCNLTPPGNLAWRIQGVTCHLLEIESRNLQQTAYIKSHGCRKKKKKDSQQVAQGFRGHTTLFSWLLCVLSRHRIGHKIVPERELYLVLEYVQIQLSVLYTKDGFFSFCSFMLTTGEGKEKLVYYLFVWRSHLTMFRHLHSDITPSWLWGTI